MKLQMTESEKKLFKRVVPVMVSADVVALLSLIWLLVRTMTVPNLENNSSAFDELMAWVFILSFAVGIGASLIQLYLTLRGKMRKSTESE